MVACFQNEKPSFRATFCDAVGWIDHRENLTAERFCCPFEDESTCLGRIPLAAGFGNQPVAELETLLALELEPVHSGIADDLAGDPVDHRLFGVRHLGGPDEHLVEAAVRGVGVQNATREHHEVDVAEQGNETVPVPFGRETDLETWVACWTELIVPANSRADHGRWRQAPARPRHMTDRLQFSLSGVSTSRSHLPKGGCAMTRRWRWMVVALVGAMLAPVPIGRAEAGPAACDNRNNNTVDKLLECVTLAGVREHQLALQKIADANGGNRFSGLPGHDRSVDYVVSGSGPPGTSPWSSRSTTSPSWNSVRLRSSKRRRAR